MIEFCGIDCVNPKSFYSISVTHYDIVHMLIRSISICGTGLDANTLF